MEKSWWEPLQENLTLESPFFLHACRLGLGAVIGVFIYTYFKIPHGFWIGLTLCFVLKPDFGLTFQRYLYRIVGTVLGVIAVTLIISYVHDSQWLSVIGIFSAFFAFSTLRFHYSVFVFFITFFYMILAQFHSSGPGDNFELYRIVSTLIGCIIAHILSFGLARTDEKLSFINAIALSLKDINQYFQAVMGVYQTKSIYQPSQLSDLRNKSRLSMVRFNNAFHKMKHDPTIPSERIEPANALTDYVFLLQREITIFLTQLEDYKPIEPNPQIDTFTNLVVQSLSELSESLENGTEILPLPKMDDVVDGIHTNFLKVQQEYLKQPTESQKRTRLRFNNQNILTQEKKQR